MTYSPTLKEVICEIQNKLTVITDLLNFCQTLSDHNIGTYFRNKTPDGLVNIIDDCIDKLEVLKNETDRIV